MSTGNPFILWSKGQGHEAQIAGVGRGALVRDGFFYFSPQ